MVLNYIWIGFFLIALLVAIIKSFQGEVGVFADIVNSTFDMAGTAFEISLGLTGILCLWMGIMKIGEEGGSVQLMSRLVGPFFDRLFPGVPKDHPARGSMLLNFTANMLGLDNASTPAGLKAMDQLQELNPEKEKATNAMIMFLVLNTSGLTLIPVTVMTYRAQMGAAEPSDVFLPILISTFFASLVGLITVAIYQKINLFDKVILAYLLGMTGVIIVIIYYFQSLSPEELSRQSSFFSNIILFGIICSFIIMAIRKKVNVYEAFIDGAKGGFNIAIKIIPYLVAILVAIGVFRASGALDYLEQGMAWFFSLFLENTEFTKGLPTAFMKPLSGSGARGMMLESWGTYGVDSFIGKLTATLQGATDTTFYIIAVYFGAVGIKKTRYAVKAGLLADLAGIIAAIVIATVWFGGDKGVVHDAPEVVVSEFGDAWIDYDPVKMKSLLSENCVLYDQAFDTLLTDNVSVIDVYFNGENDEFRTVESIRSVIQDDNDLVYMKIIWLTDSSKFKGTYEIEVDKGKIERFKYLGEF
ncbi:MAG: nucleoside recognition domain-containing protein [Crocinitomicaceae bacterium]